VMLGTDIETVDGSNYSTIHYPNDKWWRLVDEAGNWIHCTPNHRLYDSVGVPLEASKWKVGGYNCTPGGDYMVVESGPFNRACTKVMVSMPKLHMYWANGWLSHNTKILPP